MLPMRAHKLMWMPRLLHFLYPVDKNELPTEMWDMHVTMTNVLCTDLMQIHKHMLLHLSHMYPIWLLFGDSSRQDNLPHCLLHSLLALFTKPISLQVHVHIAIIKGFRGMPDSMECISCLISFVLIPTRPIERVITCPQGMAQRKPFFKLKGR